jgi:hypothetical protein
LAEVVIVALAVGGVSAYVWSVIDQADSSGGAAAGSSNPPEAPAAASLPAPLSPRDALSRLRTWDLQSRLGTTARRVTAVAATAVGLALHGTRAIRARWARRAGRRFEREGRRIRFEETAELTLPTEPSLAGGAQVRRAAEDWADRPSRLLAALGLLLMIVVVGAVLAAAIFAVGELVSGAVGSGRGS